MTIMYTVTFQRHYIIGVNARLITHNGLEWIECDVNRSSKGQILEGQQGSQKKATWCSAMLAMARWNS